MRLSVAIPCFGRPQRTRRLISCLDKQTINGLEMFIIGDGCPHFQEILDSEEYKSWIKDMDSRGNRVISFNLDKNYGGFGYKARNYAKDNATGKYMTYVDNDDVIENDHFEFYLSEIEGTDLDLVYYNSFIRPYGSVRDSHPLPGFIGHSEVIILTETLRKAPPHTSDYNADWILLEYLFNSGIKMKKSESTKTTYFVSSVTHEYDGVQHRIDFDVNGNID